MTELGMRPTTDPSDSLIPAMSLDSPSDNAMNALYRAALGPMNSAYYLPVFDRFDATGRTTTTWNWAASVFTLGWMVFRQLWSPALVYVAAAEGLALLVFALGRVLLQWPQGIEWGVLATVAVLAFAVPGMYGNAMLHTDIRKRIARALAASRTVPEACEMLAGQASTRRRLQLVVLGHAALVAAAALAYLLIPQDGSQRRFAMEPEVTVAQATSASAAASAPVAAGTVGTVAEAAAASDAVASEASAAPVTAPAPAPGAAVAPPVAAATAASPSPPNPAASGPATAPPGAATSTKAAPTKATTTSAPPSAPASEQRPASSLATAAASAPAAEQSAPAPTAPPAAAPAPSASSDRKVGNPPPRDTASQRAAASAKPAAEAPAPAPAASRAASKSAKAAASTAGTATSDGALPAPVGSLPGYYINVGLFAEEANARKAQARLLNEGLPAFRQELSTAAGQRIRVRVGPYTTKAQADKAAAAIRAMQLEAVVFRK